MISYLIANLLVAADWNTLGREICRWRSRYMKMVDHVIARMADYVTFDRYTTVAMNIARRGAITPIKPMTAVTIANTTTTIRAIIMNDNNENVDGRWLWRRSRQWAVRDRVALPRASKLRYKQAASYESASEWTSHRSNCY